MVSRLILDDTMRWAHQPCRVAIPHGFQSALRWPNGKCFGTGRPAPALPAASMAMAAMAAVAVVRKSRQYPKAWMAASGASAEASCSKHWEVELLALMVVLCAMEKVTFQRLLDAHKSLQYDWGHGVWAVALAKVLLEQGHDSGGFDLQELGHALGDASNGREAFNVGDRVRLRTTAGRPASRWRRPHLPVPGSLEGVTGTVVKTMGMRSDPAFFRFSCEIGLVDEGCQEACYCVSFPLQDVTPVCWRSPHSSEKAVLVEVFQSWLQGEFTNDPQPVPLAKGPRAKPPKRRSLRQSLRTVVQEMHDAGLALQVGPKIPKQAHDHLPRAEVEQGAVDEEGTEEPGQRLTEALMGLTLREVGAAAVPRAVEIIEELGSEALGPRVVARAWLDEGFRTWLLTDANEAIRSLDSLANHSKVKVVESTSEVHNLLVCTLCSCYPVSLLGLAPSWYKSREYRTQAIHHPRELLQSFGLEVPSKVNIHVLDSNADLRYFVLPRRPAGTDAWSEEQLMELVTRDTMIGVAVPEV